MFEKVLDNGLAITYLTVGILMLIIGVVMYSLVSDFKPFTVDELSVVSPKVCPSELVAIDGDITLDDGLYVIDVDPSWTNVDTGEFWEIAEAQLIVNGPVNTKEGSESLVYATPAEPGNWQFALDIHVKGRNGILPREQNIRMVKTTEVTEVVDCGDSYTYEQYLKETQGE